MKSFVLCVIIGSLIYIVTKATITLLPTAAGCLSLGISPLLGEQITSTSLLSKTVNCFIESHATNL